MTDEKFTSVQDCITWLNGQEQSEERDRTVAMLEDIKSHYERNGKKPEQQGDFYLVAMSKKNFVAYMKILNAIE